MKKAKKWLKDKFSKKKNENPVVLTPLRKVSKVKRDNNGSTVILLYIVFGVTLSLLVECGLKTCGYV